MKHTSENQKNAGLFVRRNICNGSSKSINIVIKEHMVFTYQFTFLLFPVVCFHQLIPPNLLNTHNFLKVLIPSKKTRNQKSSQVSSNYLPLTFSGKKHNGESE